MQQIYDKYIHKKFKFSQIYLLAKQEETMEENFFNYYFYIKLILIEICYLRKEKNSEEFNYSKC